MRRNKITPGSKPCSAAGERLVASERARVIVPTNPIFQAYAILRVLVPQIILYSSGIIFLRHQGIAVRRPLVKPLARTSPMALRKLLPQPEQTPVPSQTRRMAVTLQPGQHVDIWTGGLG